MDALADHFDVHAADNLAAGKPERVNPGATLRRVDIRDFEPRLEPKHMLADITKARKLLDWRPLMSFADGMSELKREYGLV